MNSHEKHFPHSNKCCALTACNYLYTIGRTLLTAGFWPLAVPNTKSNRTKFIAVDYYFWIVLLLLAFTNYPSIGQPVIEVGQKLKYKSIGSYIGIFKDTTCNLKIDYILQNENKLNFKKNDKDFINEGHPYATFWVRLLLHNPTENDTTVLLELGETFLNYISCYLIEKKEVVRHYKAGESVPVDQRVYPHIHSVFPIELKGLDTIKVMLFLDSRLEPLNSSIKLWDVKAFSSQTEKGYWFFGILLGILFFSATISAFLALLTKRKLFTYYSVYIFNFAFFILSFTNLGYQFLWKNSYFFSHFSKMLFLILTVIAHFALVFTFFKSYAFIQRFKKLYQGVSIILILILIVYSTYLGTETSEFWQKLYFIPLLTASIPMLGLFFILLILTIRFPNLENKLFLTAYSLVYLSPILGLLVNNKILPRNFFFQNFFYFAVLIEFIIISYLILARVQQTFKDKLILSNQLAKKQEENIKQYIYGQEKERQRLAQQLHDGASLHLANIQMRLSNIMNKVEGDDNKSQLNSILDELSYTSQDIRNFSHALSSVVLERYGLEFALEDLIIKLENSYKAVNFEFQCEKFDKSDLSNSYQQNFYYIAQELLQNSLKHSEATLIKLEFKKNIGQLGIKSNRQWKRLYI